MLVNELLSKTFFCMIFFAMAGCSSFSSISAEKVKDNFKYDVGEQFSKFYSDKLYCENNYFHGYGFFSGEKIFGNIFEDGSAKDCMFSKGYKKAQ